MNPASTSPALAGALVPLQRRDAGSGAKIGAAILVRLDHAQAYAPRAVTAVAAAAADGVERLSAYGAGWAADVAAVAAARDIPCTAVIEEDAPTTYVTLLAALGAEIQRGPGDVPGSTLVDPAEGLDPPAEDVEGDVLVGYGRAPEGAATRRVGVTVSGTSSSGLFPASRMDAADELISVDAREAIAAARAVARDDGLLVGPASGAVLAVARRLAGEIADDMRVIAVLPDGGAAALATIHDEAWLRRHGLLADTPALTAADLLSRKGGGPQDMVMLAPDASVDHAIRIMQDLEVSQIPIVDEGEVVGTIREDQVIDLLLHTPERKDGPVADVMDDPLREITPDADIEDIQAMIVAGGSALIVRWPDGRREILTKYDLIHGLARESGDRDEER